MPLTSARRNAEFVRQLSAGVALLRSTRELAAGEEVLTDYGKSYWKTGGTSRFNPARATRRSNASTPQSYARHRERIMLKAAAMYTTQSAAEGAHRERRWIRMPRSFMPIGVGHGESPT